VDPTDVMRVVSGIWFLPAAPEWRDDVRRMLDLMIDGRRYGVPERARQRGREPKADAR
jgi:hypothetical protein